MFDPSLSDLVIFAPSNSAVIQYIAHTKSKWSNGKYWLGGQIQLSPDEKITNILITNVNKIYNDTNDYAYNSFELASIRHAKSNFEQIQDVVKQYREEAKNNLLMTLTKQNLIKT